MAESLHRRMLDECWRPAFVRYLRVRSTELERDLERWLRFYDLDRSRTGRLTSVGFRPGSSAAR